MTEWRTAYDPPSEATSYLTTCVDGDGKRYMAIHYFSNGTWFSAGPFVRVLAWMPLPAPPPL